MEAVSRLRCDVAMYKPHNASDPTGRKSNMEEVQDELMHRLTLGRRTQQKLPLPARSASMPTMNITYDSAPDEVKSWLELKGFNTV